MKPERGTQKKWQRLLRRLSRSARRCPTEMHCGIFENDILVGSTVGAPPQCKTSITTWTRPVRRRRGLGVQSPRLLALAVPEPRPVHQEECYVEWWHACECCSPEVSSWVVPSENSLYQKRMKRAGDRSRKKQREKDLQAQRNAEEEAKREAELQAVPCAERAPAFLASDAAARVRSVRAPHPNERSQRRFQRPSAMLSLTPALAVMSGLERRGGRSR